MRGNDYGHGLSVQPRRRSRYEKMKWVEYGQSKWGDIALARWLHWVYGPKEGRLKRKVDAGRAGEGEIIAISIHRGRLFPVDQYKRMTLNYIRYRRH